MKAPTLSSLTIFRGFAFALATLSLVCIGYGLSVKPKDRVRCEKPVVDLGTMTPESAQQAVFHVVNSGRSPVKVRRISTSCGCTEARVSSDTIPGHGDVRVVITFKAGKSAGERAEKCSALLMDEVSKRHYAVDLYVKAKVAASIN